ncbi:MAG: hypothetical protein LBK93_01115 [Rickettsiales bacterium]|jgi:hypothetical protein|nr:hypothetical protein [Rickettsiales bacterium]
MKRILVPISEKQNKSVKYLREKGISIIKRELIRIREKYDKLIERFQEEETAIAKRKIIRIRERKNNSIKRFREEERSTLDLQALRDVQNQLDSLIEEMMNAKMTLVGLAIGADEVEAYSNASHSHEEYEIE